MYVLTVSSVGSEGVKIPNPLNSKWYPSSANVVTSFASVAGATGGGTAVSILNG